MLRCTGRPTVVAHCPVFRCFTTHWPVAASSDSPSPILYFFLSRVIDRPQFSNLWLVEVADNLLTVFLVNLHAVGVKKLLWVLTLGIS